MSTVTTRLKTPAALGQAIAKSLGDSRGIRRYGSATIPMDESLVTVAIDLGGRFAFYFSVDFPVPTIGSFDAQLVEVFWESVAATAAQIFMGCCTAVEMDITLPKPCLKHLRELSGRLWKSIRDKKGVPSTKGTLTQN